MKPVNVNRDNYIRVTEVLEGISGLGKIPEHILEKAAERGTRVHRACTAEIHNQEMWEICVDIAPYIQSFRKWYQNGKNVIHNDLRFYCDELQLTGEVDMIYQENEENILIDIKTSQKESSTWKLQLSAYKYLAEKNGIPIHRLMVVQLKKDGSNPTVYEYYYDWDSYKREYDVYMFLKRRDQQTQIVDLDN